MSNEISNDKVIEWIQTEEQMEEELNEARTTIEIRLKPVITDWVLTIS